MYIDGLVEDCIISIASTLEMNEVVRTWDAVFNCDGLNYSWTLPGVKFSAVSG